MPGHSVTMCYYGSLIIVLFALLCDCFSTSQSQDSFGEPYGFDACVLLKSMRLPLSISLVHFSSFGIRCVVVAVLCVVFFLVFGHMHSLVQLCDTLFGCDAFGCL